MTQSKKIHCYAIQKYTFRSWIAHNGYKFSYNGQQQQIIIIMLIVSNSGVSNFDFWSAFRCACNMGIVIFLEYVFFAWL